MVPPSGVEARPLGPGGRVGVQDVDLVQVVGQAVLPALTAGVSPAPDDEDETGGTAGQADCTVVTSQWAGRVSGRTEAPGETRPTGEYLELR